MAFYPGLVPLRDVLADLYTTEGHARVVVGDAGIPEQEIDFSGSALEFWQSILSAAHRTGRVQNVIDAARRTYSAHAQLIEAEQVFHDAPVPDLPSACAPSPQNGDPDSGNTTINVGGDNSGIIVGGDVDNAAVQNVGDVSGDKNVIGIDSHVTIGGISAVEEPPTPDRFRQMIQELQVALEGLIAQSALLEQIDPAAPFTAPGAAKQVDGVAADLKTDNAKAVKSFGERLCTASTLLEAILDKASSLAEKATDTGRSAALLAAQLSPIVAKLGLAIAWAAKLWPAG